MERLLIGPCEILVGAGLADADPLPERAGRTGAALLTQPGAAAIGRAVARRIRDGGLACPVRVLPDGEAAKSLAVVEDVYRWLADSGIDRHGTVVAVGGGSLTDAAGFAAATYLRGIEAVYVPTTLLGAVDAAVGGKTGVNLDGKNLVGAFRHPSRIVVDTGVLAALSDGLWREGAAEALKAGLIGDPALVDLFERHGREAPIDEVVRRALAVKVGIVNQDFTEEGLRAVLNYGHTVGHAVEVACGLSHGAAVAVGMVAAGAASERVAGFAEADRQRALIASLGLPVTAPGADEPRVRELLALDKKRDAAGLRMVLLRRIGEPYLAPVDAATVDAALAAVAAAPDPAPKETP